MNIFGISGDGIGQGGRHYVDIGERVDKHGVEIAAITPVMEVLGRIGKSPVLRPDSRENARNDENKKPLRRQYANEFAEGPGIVAHMLEHMGADDDIESGVGASDCLKIQGVVAAVNRQLGASEP